MIYMGPGWFVRRCTVSMLVTITGRSKPHYPGCELQSGTNGERDEICGAKGMLITMMLLST